MNIIKIHYCTQCKWMLRASWMLQELLQTFTEIDEIALVPGTGGVFKVVANEQEIWNRKEKQRFPEVTELKRLVRDTIAPEKDLGHIDRKYKK